MPSQQGKEILEKRQIQKHGPNFSTSGLWEPRQRSQCWGRTGEMEPLRVPVRSFRGQTKDPAQAPWRTIWKPQCPEGSRPGLSKTEVPFSPQSTRHQDNLPEVNPRTCLSRSKSYLHS